MYKILSVDDEPINQAIVEELLGQHFDVGLVSSGEECLSKIDSIKPELILMDVSMPGIDGYETCCKLKAQERTRHIPVYFVSARSTLEDKIKGHEAGGHDYITKPFNHTELEAKIEQTIHYLIATSKTQIKKTLEIDAMAYSRDPDAVNNYIESSVNCTSVNELGELLLNTCRHLQLNCTFQFQSDSASFNYFSHNEITPLELSLLEQTLNQDRFFDFNTRTIVTFPHISCLIKNMPVDDMNLYNELKAFLDTLLEETETRLKILLNDDTSSS